MKKQLHSTIFFSTGLGDALQLIPLCRVLKRNEHHLTGIFTSNCPIEELIVTLGILDEYYVLENKQAIWAFVKTKFRTYDTAFIEHSASSLNISLFACLISKKAITNRQKWYLKILPNLQVRKPLGQAPLLLQNLHLAFPNQPFPNIKQLFHFDTQQWEDKSNYRLQFDQYIVVQVAAANNSVDYKNWSIENWSVLLRKISNWQPHLNILLTGDENEIGLGEKLIQANIANLHSLIGKTSLMELASLLKHANMYLGLDSGSMHLAVMLGTPTLTIWGPTDPVTLGYQVFDSKKHMDISTNLHCHPCLSWIRPNTSLHKHPLQCPHRNCIQQISPDMVFQLFMQHWALQSAAATF